MSCIFESNLRNNPMHNRHILREEFGDRPFMPEDPTDGKPEEMPEAEVADDLANVQNDIDQEKVVQIYAEKIRWPENSDGDPDDYEEDTEDMGQKSFDDAEEVYKELVDLGVQQNMKATGSTWWQSEVENDYTEGWEITYTIHPESGFTQEDIDYINGRISGEIENPDPKFSKWDRDDGYGDEDEETVEDSISMESCVMGSNLLGHGGYGKAILREMVDDGEPDVPNLEPDDEPDTPVADEDADSAEQTVGERISQQFDGSPSMINQGIEFMMERGYKIDDPSYTVDEDVWDEMANTVIGFNDEFETDPEAELVAASDYYDEHPYEVEGATTDEVPTAESYELHSLLTVEGQPKYEEPEVKKEPKPKPPRLTAKRNRRLRSKSRNIQIWDSKKKCFDPRYINTRFTRMSDAKDAIAKIGESCCCCGCDKPKAKGKAKGKPVNKKFAKLKEAAMAELGGDMGQTYGNHMDEFGRGDVIQAMPPDGGENVVYVLKKERDWYGEYVIKNVETKEQEYSTDDWEDAVTTLYDMARRKQLKVVKNRSPEGRVRGYKAIRTPYAGMSTRHYDNDGKYIGDYE